MVHTVAKAMALPERERGVCCPQKLRLRPERADGLVDVLKALADPTRLQMVAALRDAESPVCVCDFTATFVLTQPTVSHHMARLREVGLVDCRRLGVWAYYTLRTDLAPGIRRLIEAI